MPLITMDVPRGAFLPEYAPFKRALSIPVAGANRINRPEVAEEALERGLVDLVPRLGQEGLAVTQGWHRGVLLPSASEGRRWDAEQFLKHACLAAGLTARAHLDPDTVVEVFEAEEFGE